MLEIQDNTVVRQLHQPKLDTIKMVEVFIKEHSGEYKKKALWEHLPKKMMYQTYSNTIEYLLESNKIATDRKGYIIWIWDPEIAKKYLLRDNLAIE